MAFRWRFHQEPVPNQNHSDYLAWTSSEYTSEGFGVLKGSSGRAKNMASIERTADQRFRERLIAEGVRVEQGGVLVFVKDHLFRSPSMAAVARLGRRANGWRECKSAEGWMLNDLKRNTA